MVHRSNTKQQHILLNLIAASRYYQHHMTHTHTHTHACAWTLTCAPTHTRARAHSHIFLLYKWQSQKPNSIKCKTNVASNGHSLHIHSRSKRGRLEIMKSLHIIYYFPSSVYIIAFIDYLSRISIAQIPHSVVLRYTCINQKSHR